MSAFKVALARALKYEGGYVDHPLDKGGPTNRGITHAVYDAYRDQIHKPRRPVQFIEDSEVEAIYFERYWSRGKCIAIESAKRPLLAQVHFDACITHGHGGPGKEFGSAELLQRALGVTEDGSIGPVTLASVAAQDEATVTGRYLDARTIYFARIVKHDATQKEFLEGWLSRVIQLRNEIISPVARAA